MKVAYSAAALEEIESITRFYMEQYPELGHRFQADLWQAEELLIRNPQAGSIAFSDFRRLLLPVFPYSLIYRLDLLADIIRVVAVAHHRRRSGYWRNRVQETPAVYELAA